LLEILIIGGLIYLGWEIPFKQRVDQLNGRQPVDATSVPVAATPISDAATPSPVPRLRPLSRITPTPSGAWMWDSRHRAPLDPPSHTRPTPR